ncbi:hypothetical protein GQ457_02G023250 [Hibiscus cannabinus]
MTGLWAYSNNNMPVETAERSKEAEPREGASELAEASSNSRIRSDWTQNRSCASTRVLPSSVGENVTGREVGPETMAQVADHGVPLEGSGLPKPPNLAHHLENANEPVHIELEEMAGDNISEEITFVYGENGNYAVKDMLHLAINCSVLMGANIANEIFMQKCSEATVGYRDKREIVEQWVWLFSTPYFLVTPVSTINVP